MNPRNLARTVLFAALLAVSVFCRAGGLCAASLEVEICHTFNGEPLLLDSLRYQNAVGEALSVTRLSYLLSGFALERVGGGWVELPPVYAWIDVAQHRASVTLDGVPDWQYRALRFSVGPDPAANAADPARWPAGHPLNPNVNGLYWGWQGGYIFLALEGRWRKGPAEVNGYAFHVAHDANRTCVQLAVSLDLTHRLGVLLDFDVAALLGSPQALSFERDGAATHSREGDPVAAALVADLPGAFRLQQVISAQPAITLPSVVRPLYLPPTFTPYRLVIGKTFPVPELPRDNPLTEERVALGRKLFHETALSRGSSLSCVSCHREAIDYTDPRRFSVGVDGQVGARHAMSLSNLAWKTSFSWDGRASTLRAQVLRPIGDHAEMAENLDRVVAKLSSDPAYPPLFRAAFGAPDISAEKLGLALENYLLTLVSCHAKFDRVLRGQGTFTPVEQRGFELFTTEYEPRTGQRGADCFHCHGGPFFTDHQFHNNGLGETAADPGRFLVTAFEGDRGKFSTPSLRNVARRGPYMHDGRYDTLGEVVAHYDHGVVRGPTLDPNLAKHPPEGLRLSASDQEALVAFLNTLNNE